MKQKKITIGKGLNKMVYNRNEIPVDGVKLPFDRKDLCADTNGRISEGFCRSKRL